MSVTTVLAGFKERTHNYYQGMNIMSIRGIDLANVLEKTLQKDKPILYQDIFDAGKALLDVGIVIYDKDTRSYIMNKDFGDYDSWHTSSDIILENCKLMAKLGHPNYA